MRLFIQENEIVANWARILKSKEKYQPKPATEMVKNNAEKEDC